MKIIILGGFLGSGKTTVLINLVSLLSGRKPQPSIAILENEISTSAVDSLMLKSRGMTVKNLSAGCICCTSKALLMDSVKEVYSEFAPDYLITEATGMAYPDTILQTIRAESDFPACVLSIVDASRWEKLLIAMPDFIRGQLRMADTIFLNKTDLVSQKKAVSILEQLKSFTDCNHIFAISAASSIPESLFTHIV